MIKYFMHSCTEYKRWGLDLNAGSLAARNRAIGRPWEEWWEMQLERKADAWHADRVEQRCANSRTLRRELVDLIYIFQSSPWLHCGEQTHQRAKSGTGRPVGNAVGRRERRWNDALHCGWLERCGRCFKA